MNKKENLFIKNKNIELIMLYFKYRNIFDIGYQPYKVFKNIIIFVTGITTKTYIKNLFETLLAREVFHLKYRYGSRFYIFNPYNCEVNQLNNTIDFD